MRHSKTSEEQILCRGIVEAGLILLELIEEWEVSSVPISLLNPTTGVAIEMDADVFIAAAVQALIVQLDEFRRSGVE